MNLMGVRFLTFLLFFSEIAISQDLKFEYLTSDDGLSHSSVTCIIKDNEGFMWFGTQNGLNRYDGYSFVKYYHDAKDTNTIAGDQIQDLLVDHEGKLWIGTNNGLSLYDRNRGTFINYSHNDSIPSSFHGSSVTHLFEDSKYRLWVGSIGGGINLFNKEKNNFSYFVHDPDKPNSISSNDIRGIVEDKHNVLWFGTETSGLNRFIEDKKTFIRYFHDDADPNSLSHNAIYDLTIDKQGNVWVGTLGGGLCQVLEGSGNSIFINYRPETSDIRRLKILTLTAARKGGIWLGTENGGLDYFNATEKSFRNYQIDEMKPNTLNNNSIHAIYEDPTGNLWIGTYTGGVNVHKNNKKKIFTYRKILGNKNSLSYNAVSSFFEDTSGKIWIGTDGGGVNLWDRTTDEITHYTSQNTSMLSDAVLAICADRDQNIWVGGWEVAFNKYNGNNAFTTYTNNDGIPNNNIFDMVLDHKDNLWATFGGIGFGKYNYDTKTFEVYSAANINLLSPWVLDINIDYSNNILLGDPSGFSIFYTEEGILVNYAQNDADTNSLSQNQINTILVSHDSTIWIGTVNGLNHFFPKEQKFIRYYEQQGLPNNNIAGLVEDDHGNLWISTGNGISVMDNFKHTFKNYGLTDGIQGKSYIRNSAYKTSSGEILFGGTNGFNIFHPDSLSDNKFVPPVVITGFFIFNKPVSVNDVNSPLTLDISRSKRIKLTYKQSVFSFEFVALDYTAPNQNQYAYMLEGFDDDWNYVGTKRTASYTNLDAGKYIFRVKGSNNDGVWNEEGTSIEVIIKPPFWKTWLFRIVLISAILYSLFFVYKRRMAQMKHDKMILEGKIKDGEVLIQQKMAEVEKQAEEIKERDLREVEIRFVNIGIVLFSEIIAAHGANLKILLEKITSQLVEYVGANMGTIFVVDEDGNSDIILRMEASYALDRDKSLTEFRPGEGYVGTCFSEQVTLTVHNLPEGYAKLLSGLGETLLENLYLIPLKYTDNIQGVIEVISIQPLEEYKIKFLEKIAENITSFIAITKANEQTKILLENADSQTAELQAQEEEMKQNMEEMMATQEETRRREERWSLEKSVLLEKDEQLKKELVEMRTELEKLKNKS